MESVKSVGDDKGGTHGKTGKSKTRRERSYPELVKAVKELRGRLGDSQQAFATRFGLSIRSVANYEKDRKPEPRVLGAFLRRASNEEWSDLHRVFSVAISRDQRLSDIKGPVMSYAPSILPRGHAVIPFRGESQYIYVKAIYRTFTKYLEGDAQSKAEAEKLLDNLVSETSKVWAKDENEADEGDEGGN